MKAFLDTNVLLYAAGIDRSAAKFRVAHDLLGASRTLAVSVQVLNEFVSQATRESRKHRIPFDEAIAFANTLRRFDVVSLDTNVFDAAARLKVETGYNWWDSLIVAAAITAGCETLLTEDMQHGRVIDGLRIENPFRELA